MNLDSPAFPTHRDVTLIKPGMTLRQYAAIKLKVPDSGTDGLDDMIRKSLKNDFAAKAMVAILSDPAYIKEDHELAIQSFNVADAMLKAREA